MSSKKCKKKFANCKAGGFVNYIESNPEFRGMNTEQAARRILSGRSRTKFTKRTKRRAKFFLVMLEKRRAARRKRR